MIARRESQHLRDQSRKRRGCVRAAIGKRDFHSHVAIGAYVEVAAENIRARRGGEFGERLLTFVIAHIPAMMLRHAEAKSALESSRRAPRHGISLFPSKGLRAFLKNLD